MNTFDKEAKFKFIPRGGNFYRNMDDARLKPSDKLRRLGRLDVKKHVTDAARETSDGLALGGAKGLLRMSNKRASDFVNRKWGDFKIGFNEWDQRNAQKIIDKTKMKQGGMLHRMMTTKENIPLAEATGLDGKARTLYDIEGRTPSLFATAQNTARIATPLLASLYVGEKIFPMDGDQPEEKLAGVEDRHYQDLQYIELDKQAALSKVAVLEEKLFEKEELLKLAYSETNQANNRLRILHLEKQSMATEIEELEKTATEKTALYEELHLRTKARERSNEAIKIAEEMLEQGMIKQAEFDSKVDYLMDCDNETFKLYGYISKTSNYKEKLLETSSGFVETINRNEIPSSKRGISKTGQTIGEAASDLIK